MFICVIQFHPSVISEGKARSPPVGCGPIRGSTWVSFILAWEYNTRVEGTNCDTDTQAFYDMESILTIKSFITNSDFTTFILFVTYEWAQ